MTHIFPMLRILPAALACLVISASVVGTASAEDKKTDLEKLVDRVAELEKKQASAIDNTNSSLAIINGEVIALRAAVKELKDKLDAKPAATSDGTPRKMPLTIEDELRLKLEKAERDIADLKAQVKAGTSTSQRIDTAPVTMLPANSAQIRIVNSFPNTVAVSVNGRIYDMAPMEEKVLVIPAGTYSYQLVEYEAFPRNRTVRAGETRDINIRP